MIKSGALCDPPTKQGLAHFTEHIVGEHIVKKYAKGTRHGERLNSGATSPLTTRYGITVPHTVAKKRLRTLVRCVFAPPCSTHTERERSVILREHNERWPIPHKRILAEEVGRVVARNTPLEGFASPLGNPQSISSISATDIEDFHRQHYVGSNTVLILVGPLDKVCPEDFVRASKIEDAPQGHPSRIASFEHWIRPDKHARKVTIPCDTTHGVGYNEFGIAARIEFPADYNRSKRDALTSIVCATLREEAFGLLREQNAWTYGIDTRVASHHSDFWTIRIGCMTPTSVSEDNFLYNLGIAHAAAQRNRRQFAKIRSHTAAFNLIDEWTTAKIVMALCQTLCLSDTTFSTLENFDSTLAVTFDDFEYAHKSILDNRVEFALLGT